MTGRRLRGEGPAECLGSNPNVTDLVNTITEGDVPAAGTVYGETTYGAVTSTGPVALFVNGKALPITPAAVPGA